MSAVSLLGDILVEANALLEHWKNRKKVDTGALPDRIQGKRASGGVVSGLALPIWGDIDAVVQSMPPKGSVLEEKALFEKALSRSRVQLEEFRMEPTLKVKAWFL